MNFLLVISISLIISIATCTISPQSKKQKKDKGKVESSKKGPVNQNVFNKGLVIKDPKNVDILKECGLYYKNTIERYFSNEVLGYITPWNGGGLEVAKIFHGKFTTISPVWFTIDKGVDDTLKIATHDVQKKWLKEMKNANNKNHTVRILPRILFDRWSSDEILSLNTNNEKKNQLISALVDTAKAYQFNGYVLEIWNQFVYTVSNAEIVVNIIKSLAKKLKTYDYEVILAIPPIRGPEPYTFSQTYFDELSSYIDYFSLMTYDYSNVQRPGPNSPILWVNECIKTLVPDNNDPRRKQILMGLNFYGNNYTPDGGGPILGHEYLKLLEYFKGKFQWDDKSCEHFFQYRSPTGSGYVFYPTLYSLHLRIQLAQELGTGISIWELGQGLNYFYDLF